MKRNRLLALFLALLLLTGCSGAANDEAYDYVIAETSAAMHVEELKELTGEASIGDYSRFNAKLIRTVRLDAQTKDYDGLMSSLDEKIADLGGYIESRDAYNGSEYYGRSGRSCTMTVRIPADRLSTFVTHVNENANVINTSENVENITLQYVDTEARVAALETEQARLLELLETAADLSAILEIESRLSDVRYELNTYGSRLREYDNLVDYATVHLDINEVQELTPTEEPTTWERIRDGFSNTIDNIRTVAVELFIWFVVNFPWLLIFGGIALAVILLCHLAGRGRKPRKKKGPYPPTPPTDGNPQ